MSNILKTLLPFLFRKNNHHAQASSPSPSQTKNDIESWLNKSPLLKDEASRPPKPRDSSAKRQQSHRNPVPMRNPDPSTQPKRPPAQPPPRASRPPRPPPPSPPPSDTITVKCRNDIVTPTTTQTFHLPRSRALLTSAYIRDQVALNESVNKSSPNKPSQSAVPSPRKKHVQFKDNILRLNFPDFDVFAIYVEWLRSGNVVTKAELRALESSSFSSSSSHSSTVPSCFFSSSPSASISSPSTEQAQAPSTSPKHSAKEAYTDYLGAYFLASWLRDMTFKDTLTSLIISHINTPHGAGYPRSFIEALTPPLVNVVMMDVAGSRGIRLLMYAAIARFGSEKDLKRWVPDEGDSCERAWVRGLGMYLLWISKEDDRRKQKGGEGEKEKEKRWAGESDDSQVSTVGATSSTTAYVLPPPFMPDIRKIWGPASEISWPSSTTGVLTQISEGNVTEDGGEDILKDFILWPETNEEHCAFHEHTYLGLPCHRKMSRR
jgi:hypothetical protein